MPELTSETTTVLAGYLSNAQLAKQLKRHQRTVRRYAEQLGLPYIVLGRTRYFRAEAVAEWLRKIERSSGDRRRRRSR